VKSLTLADLVNEAEMSELVADYGPGQRRPVTLDVSAPSFDNWLEKMVHHPNRRGEVVLVIQRPDGHILLHTKRFYPEGVFRLPSGGVHPDEAVLAGVTREAKEETGLDVTVDRFLGTVEYEFRNDQRRLPFVSYLFVLQADNSTPAAHDPGEEITGFRYISPTRLRQVAFQLRALPPQWTDWGHFRALPHDMVADALQA
jgi:8-oxo-dGTP pyrophosphatase MutT (NUDIX family)